MIYPLDIYGKVLIDHVLPLLGQAVLDAGVEAAKVIHGEPDVFEIEHAREFVIYALADYLLLTENDHSEEWKYPSLRPHQLINTMYAKVFFEVDDE